MTVQVSVREAEMLRSVQSLFVGAPRVRRGDPPERLGPEAMQVLENTLRTGVVSALVRRGGWVSRLWRTTPQLELRFSAASFELCRWLAGSESSPGAASSVGDALLHYLAADALQRANRSFAPIASSPLVSLAFAQSTPADWTLLMNSNGLIVLEAVQEDLARAWVRQEHAKTELVDATAMLTFGTQQRKVLEGFFGALETVGRRDLARFAVVAAARLVDRPAHRWIASLGPTTLAQRSEATRASAAFLSSLAQLARWHQQWAMVRFIDDEYEQAQKHLSAWDVLGTAGFERAAALADALVSLREMP